MNKVSWTDRLRYAFDNTLSKGPIALIGWLALVSFALVIVIALIVWGTGIAPEQPGLGKIAWMGLMRTLDAGTMGGDEGSWPFLFSMFAVTLGGVFVISTLIGVLTAGIEGKVEDLRKGRSRVIETGHTVILGWSNQIFTIISELVIANQNRPRSCIAILSSKDKVEMEEEVRGQAGPTGRTRIVCRHGEPMDMNDLELVGLSTARSIIILAPDVEDSDADVIKVMLAITNNPKRRPQPYHVVAEIRDPKNLEVARMVGKDEVELVLIGDLVSRVIAQTCRQSGLSVVYTGLLDSGGDEIYFQYEPGLAGKTFGEALLAYEDSSVIGLCQKGIPRLNPPMDTPIGPDDQVIAISEDDDTVVLSGLTALPISHPAIRGAVATVPRPERTLMLGWNWRAPFIINELDHYVAAGSEVTVVADCPEGEEQIARYCSGIQRQKVAFMVGDTTNRRTLDKLEVEKYNHVVILCYCDTLDRQAADARTLITLLHLREISERYGHPFSITSEMLDIRNRNLAEVTRADDFIVSDNLVSLMLAQVSENKALNALFADIFDPEGSEIYLKPAGNYVQLGEPVSFYTVVEAARQRGEIAIGYRIQARAGDAEQSYGVVVNPDKSDRVVFSEADRVVVVAEE